MKLYHLVEQHVLPHASYMRYEDGSCFISRPAGISEFVTPVQWLHFLALDTRRN